MKIKANALYVLKVSVAASKKATQSGKNKREHVKEDLLIKLEFMHSKECLK